MKLSASFFSFGFFALILVLSCSKDSSGPDNTITVSGKVTLEGVSDYSGVKIKLFAPVQIDTALTNLNTRYPGVGRAINQNTEFYWWQQTPVRETSTGSDGSWSMENIAQGNYHIAAQKDEYGWQLKHNVSPGEHNFTLKQKIQLNGIYLQNRTIPADSYVEILGNTTFNNGTTLTIEPGVIIEFKNNSRLDINGALFCNGVAGKEVYFITINSNNNSRVKLEQSHNSLIQYAVFVNLSAPLYIRNCNAVQVVNCRFNTGNTGVELFGGTNLIIQNNIISDMQKGVLTSNTSHNFLKNLVVNIAASGMETINENNSKMEFNVIKNCLNAITIHPAGYAYSANRLEIYRNDLTNNFKHMYIGTEGFCIANSNNFLKEGNLIVDTFHANSNDSLDFRNNYWGYPDSLTISGKIVDKLDRLGQAQEGPLVDFSNFSIQYIRWIDQIN